MEATTLSIAVRGTKAYISPDIHVLNLQTGSEFLAESEIMGLSDDEVDVQLGKENNLAGYPSANSYPTSASQGHVSVWDE